MFATDFLFDGQRASDFGLMICSFNNGEIETASGGEVEYNVVKTPGRDRFTFYGSQFDSVLVWNFSVCKKLCDNGNPFFSQYEESMIAKWLIRTDGYKYFQFDQSGYEDIFYNVYINFTPHQVFGKTVGFDLTVTSDCAYGFTDIIKRKAIISSSTPLNLNVCNDINTYIFPYVKIKGMGNFYVSNNTDVMQNAMLNKASKFTNISQGSTIIMDSDLDKIEGIGNPNNFNWYFLRLVDGTNEITTNSTSNIEIEIQYREVKKVIV